MKLIKLIEASHGEEAAKAYEAFKPADEQMAIVHKVAEDCVKHFGSITHACAPMSAICAARMEFELGNGVPVYVVAGSLRVAGKWIYGTGQHFDGKKIFSEGDPSWNGHVWIMFGPHVIDVSARQTALSGRSDGALEALVRKRFGITAGPLIVPWAQAPQEGLYFAPQYVLTHDEVTAIARGAMKLLGIKE